jgi:predicted transcriptional regulator
LTNELAEEEQSPLQEETSVLKLIEQAGGILSPSELTSRSSLGMRDTLAIVSFLLRKELIAKQEEKETFLQITKKGIEMLTRIQTNM